MLGWRGGGSLSMAGRPEALMARHSIGDRSARRRAREGFGRDRNPAGRRWLPLAVAAAMLAGVAAVGPPAPAATHAPAALPALSPRLGDYLAARAAQYDHDWRRAGTLMRQAWEADPDNEQLRHEALLLTLAGGDIAAALTIARAMPADSGDAALVRLVQTVDDLAAQRFAAARARLAGVPARGVDQYLEPLLLTWIEVGDRHRQAAAAALQPLAALQGATGLHDLQAAMVADAIGDYATAASYYAHATSGDPVAPQALVLAAQFAERRGDAAAARALIERLDPDGPSGSRRIALLAALVAHARPPAAPDAKGGAAIALLEFASLLAQQEPDGALLYDRLALHLDPKSGDGRMLLAGIEEHQGRFADAAADLLEVDPSSDLRATALRQAMADLAQAGKVDEALKQGQAAIAAHPGDTDLALAYAELLRQKTRYAEAIRIYDGAIAALPPTSARRWWALYRRGVALERSHDWPRAEADLLAALMLHPDDPGLLNYLAFAWADQGVHLDRARTMLERAIELRPGDGAILDSLGWVMYRQGDFADAVKQLEHAAELDGEDATINDHLGDAYWRLGRPIDAHAEWERAARLTDDKALAEQIRAKLKDGLDPSTPRRASTE
jgi:tetratricopeptide (TPR) repeat protein